ncbi:MAG: PQQ-binding-like beta-propeller repeat protein [Anaerolineales bacterium]|nr:PQQ-binding-like beta-propeller repeat protein [Anaerolineales bacterium]
MKTGNYFQQFKAILFYGIRIIAVPTLLINIFFVLFLSIGLSQAMWDIELIDGILISLLIITPFLLLTFLGIVIVSLIISLNKKFSDITAFTLGALIGIAIAATGNIVSFLFELMSFEFISLPSIVAVVSLAYIGQKTNRQFNLEAETNLAGLDLRTVLLQATSWTIMIVCIGSIGYLLASEGYLDLLSIYIYLGYALSISLPAVFLARLLIGFLVKKIPKPTFLNWSIWQRVNNAIGWATTGVRKIIGNHPILKIGAFIVLGYGVFSGITYLILTTSSDRELWRITDYDVSEPAVINDLFIFHGYKEDRSIDCYCLYAVDKSTGKIIWSTENIAQPYSGFASSSSTSFSVYTSLELASQTGDFVYVSLNYRSSYDTTEQVLFALRSSDGKVIWKVDGAIDTNSFSNSIREINRIYIVDNQGDMLAIDSNTGKELWRRNVYPIYDEDYTWFTFHNDIVVVSTHSSECLKCCCTFISDEQQYEQIATYSAETGQPLWESTRLDSGRIYTFNKTLYMASRPWENSSDIDKRDDNLVTAIDLETGKERWELVFQNAHEFSVAAGAKNETIFFIKTYKGGPENFHELAKLIVVDEFTGTPIWRFNEDFSHGNLGYLINGDSVYIGTENGFVYSFDSATGNIIWKTETKHFPFHFVIEGNALVTVYEESYVSALDTKTGSQKWKLDLGIDESWSIFWDEIIGNNNNTVFIAGNNNQRIYAIDIDTGNQLWTWRHFRPTGSEYELGFIDDNVLYISQHPKRNVFSVFLPAYFVRDDWYFALKTEP